LLQVRFLLGARFFVKRKITPIIYFDCASDARGYNLYMPKHTLFMREALKEAEKAFGEDEVPVGAVIVHKGRVIARAYNQVERLNDPTAHAEMLALTSATNYLGTKWLNETSLYVTIEPCSMCAGALVLARIKNLYFGAKDPKTGACGSVLDITNNKKLNHRIKVKGGILKEECGSLLSEFFKKKRSQR
jgi:tRNA(adenine34) deaminase